MPKTNKSKEVKKFIVSHKLVGRWLLCQNIGKVFYHSELTNERLDEIKEYFERSDFLKEEVFNPTLK